MHSTTKWPRLTDFLGAMEGQINVPALSEEVFLVACVRCGELVVGPIRDSVAPEDRHYMDELVCIECYYGVQHVSTEILEDMVGEELSTLSMSREKYIEAKEITVGKGVMTEANFYRMIAKLMTSKVKVDVPEEDQEAVGNAGLQLLKEWLEIKLKKQEEDDGVDN